MTTFNLPTTLTGLLVDIIGLIILWVVISIPVYFAGKAFTKGRSDFGDAMGATLGGAVGYIVVLFGVGYFLGAVIGSAAGPISLFLALLVWLAIYRAAFRTTWLKAIGIVILAWLILALLDIVMVALFSASFPSFFPFL